VRKQFQGTGLSSWLSDAQKRKAEQFWKIASLLQEISRKSLVEMSSRLKFPISTLYDTLKEVGKLFLFTKEPKGTDKDARATGPSPLDFAYQVTMDTSEKETANKSKE